MSAKHQGPLSRFKVIDLTRARAGPTAARHFADWGAEVIKIEMPSNEAEDPMGGPRDGADFFNLHRNMRGPRRRASARRFGFCELGKPLGEPGTTQCGIGRDRKAI
jgi:hypothetical protein